MTNTVLGLGKVFSNTTQTVAANSVSSTASRTYGLQKNASGQLVVNVPWSDTNTTYTTMSQSELNTGTVTTGRTISAKVLRDTFYTKGEIDNLPSDAITDVGTFENSYAVMEHLLVNDLPTGLYKANLEEHGGFSVFINYQRTLTTAKGTVQSFDSLTVVDIDLSGSYPDFVRNDEFYINAETLPYNNSVSGLSATNVGQAIDELEANKVDKVTGKGLST